MVNGAVLLHWSRTQNVYATSSAEAELYAMEAGGAEALALCELFLDAGIHVPPPIARCDATAALGIMLEVRALVIQEWPANIRLCTVKVDTSLNLADLLTKHVTTSCLERSPPLFGLRARQT